MLPPIKAHREVLSCASGTSSKVRRMHGARGGTLEGKWNANYRHGDPVEGTIELWKLIKSLSRCLLSRGKRTWRLRSRNTIPFPTTNVFAVQVKLPAISAHSKLAGTRQVPGTSHCGQPKHCSSISQTFHHCAMVLSEQVDKLGWK